MGHGNCGVCLWFPVIDDCLAALMAGFSLDLPGKHATGNPVERDHFMTGCLRAPVSMYRSDIMSGAGSLFSPEYKTRATKTTTKTV